jgi:hypothetical protein
MEYILFMIGSLMVYHGIFHWPNETSHSRQTTNLIIDAEWEEYNPEKNRIDTYA